MGFLNRCFFCSERLVCYIKRSKSFFDDQTCERMVDLISDSLALIFTRSIETSIFSDEWKSARITPLYKKFGNRSDPSNYRPISIIPMVANVFERIVYDQLYRYLTEKKLLCCY